MATPDHDAVCLWAYDNSELIFRESCPDIFDHPWLWDEVLFHDNEDSAIALAKGFRDSNPRPNPRVTKRTLEFVLRAHTGYKNKIERIIGYADLLIETEIPCIYPQYKAADKWGEEDVFAGFTLGWLRDKKAPLILVEAKSILPTIGELMRQIQLYRTAFNGKIVVVSPDDKYAKILKEQGVTFVKYNP